MKIKILGPGCAKCKSLEKVTRQAVEELNLYATIEKIENLQKIMEYGIMRTPGLVIDNRVVLSGRIPKINEVKGILMSNQV